MHVIIYNQKHTGFDSVKITVAVIALTVNRALSRVESMMEDHGASEALQGLNQSRREKQNGQRASGSNSF